MGVRARAEYLRWWGGGRGTLPQYRHGVEGGVGEGETGWGGVGYGTEAVHIGGHTVENVIYKGQSLILPYPMLWYWNSTTRILVC